MHGISHAVRAARLDHAFADEMIRDGVSLADCRAKIIDKLAEQQDSRRRQPPGRQRPVRRRLVRDGVDRWAEGAQQGLMMRAGLSRPTAPTSSSA